MTAHVDRDRPFERVALDDGSWIDIARGLVAEPDELFTTLRDEVAWQTSRLFRYDHYVEERRLGSGWQRGRPLPHPALAEVTSLLQERYSATFGSFGMIQYRDGGDGQAFHRDTDMRWLDDTIVAILSLGQRRPWLLRPRAAKFTTAAGQGATHDVRPGSGDLHVMGGRCQADWEHSVPYLTGRPMGPRISIQWRFTTRRGQPFRGGSYSAPLHYGRS